MRDALPRQVHARVPVSIPGAGESGCARPPLGVERRIDTNGTLRSLVRPFPL